MDLLQLAERVEQAKEWEQRDVLLEAFEPLTAGFLPTPSTVRFLRMLDARAYESAALSLVPEGWPSICLGTTDDGRGYAMLAGNDAFMANEDPEECFVEAQAATPALALTSACLRAIASTQSLEGGE